MHPIICAQIFFVILLVYKHKHLLIFVGGKGLKYYFTVALYFFLPSQLSINIIFFRPIYISYILFHFTVPIHSIFHVYHIGLPYSLPVDFVYALTIQ